MPLILPANTLSGGYEVANSCRFNSADSAYMHKTPSGAGNSKTMTLSAWVKLSQSISQVRLFDAGGTAISFSGGSGNEGQFMIYENDGTERPYIGLSPVLRDYSAWYHVVVAIDTTQASSSNRVKFYINGEQITSYYQNTVPNQDETLRFNTTIQHNVGASQNPHQYFDGYIAEFCWIDGTQYAASDFGEFDEDSPTIWKPKDVSGLTFGTNGFYLDMKSSGNLGNDANGGTDLTEVNLAATDQSTDTPTNNFSVLNPLLGPRYSTQTFSNGNLTVAGGAGHEMHMSTIGVSKGKWYYEAHMDSLTNFPEVGVIEAKNVITNNKGLETYGYAYFFNGTIYKLGSSVATYNSFTTNDTIGVALDVDNAKIYFSKNGTWENSSNPADGTNPAITGLLTDNLLLGVDNYGSTWSVNFGSPHYTISSGNADANGYGNFEYAVPSGYYALNTKNLAEFG